MNDRSSTHNPVRDESNDNEEEMRLLKEQLKKQEIELKRKSSKEQTLKFKLMGQSKRRGDSVAKRRRHPQQHVQVYEHSA